ncbi:MAG: hypothetical protein U0172_11955 [Nitrospiraceae bacterium]
MHALPYASAEEADIYAWFGFVVSEVQFVEAQLLTLACLLTAQESGPEGMAARRKSYERATMGGLLAAIRTEMPLPESLLRELNRLISDRNRLAHTFFHPYVGLGEPEPVPDKKYLYEVIMRAESVSRHIERVTNGALEAL